MTSKPQPVHFLLIEDDCSHAELIRMALEENMVTNTIDHVEDGEQAISYLSRTGEYSESRRPDVVLLDIRLPKIDGHEVLGFIKGKDELKTIPVVVLTTSDAEADRMRAYESHANSYLTKPIDFQQFHKLVLDMKLYWTVWNQPVRTPPA